MAMETLSGRLRDEDKEMMDVDDLLPGSGEGLEFSSVNNTERRRRIVRLQLKSKCQLLEATCWSLLGPGGFRTFEASWQGYVRKSHPGEREENRTVVRHKNSEKGSHNCQSTPGSLWSFPTIFLIVVQDEINHTLTENRVLQKTKHPFLTVSRHLDELCRF